MRLFFAINFSKKTKEHLVRLQEELRLHSQGGNFSSVNNLHLTLAFLGECGAKQLNSAKIALNLTKVNPLEIQINGLGRFKRGNGELWWAGVAENEELLTLQQNLSNRLRSVGFGLEKRSYSPHITLARELITDLSPWEIEAFGETVRSAELMKSERVKGTLVYTALHSKGS